MAHDPSIKRLPSRIDEAALLTLPAGAAVSLRHAARLLRLHESTLREQMAAGRIVARRGKTRWSICVVEIWRYAEERMRRVVRREWTPSEIAELRLTGHCRGRSLVACKEKRKRLKTSFLTPCNTPK